jgi:hypothetical protein
MPYTPLVFKPGINRFSTGYSNEGSWYEADKVRFRDGRPETIGGWQSEALVGSLLGICRTKLTWRTNNGAILEALATSEGLWVNSDGTLYDITPIRQAFPTEANALSITSGSSTLTIAATSHGASVAERVELSGYDLTGAGISLSELNATHVIAAVPDANTVEVTLDETASSTVSGGGGTGDINFLLSPGAEGTVFGDGWGAGSFGVEAYGTPRTTLVEASRARVWSLDNWGEILVGTYRNGTPVKWDPSNDGLPVRASAITNAPKADALLVSSPDRHLVLLGSVIPGESDINRLCVRWSSQEDFTDWTVTATNTAGYQLLGNGSEILAGKQASRQIMIWSDTTITAMQYIGPPFTFGFQPLDSTPRITSRNAAVEVNGTVMWFGLNSFYLFDGVARVLPCTIKDIVFDNTNIAQTEKFFGVVNQEFNEIWWFYVSAESEEIDRYVIYDYVGQTWSYGTLARTVWEDSGINDKPTALDVDGNYYIHERGTSADGANLNAYVESAPFDIGEGDYLMFVRGIVPDARMVGSDTMEITLKGRRYPNGTETTYGPYTIDDLTDRVRTRLRVRQVTFRYESDGTDLFWQGGKPRLEIKPQGRY